MQRLAARRQFTQPRHALHCCWPAHPTCPRSAAQKQGPRVTHCAIQCSVQQPQEQEALWQQQEQQEALWQQQQFTEVPDIQHANTEQLRRALKLNPERFQALVECAPYLLDFKPYTLSITVDALCEALHISDWAVANIIAQRPSILLAPQEPVEVLQQLASILGRSSRHTAAGIGSYTQLLALSPQQLQQRLVQLCIAMHWQANDLQQAAAAVGHTAFLQLLSADPGLPEQQLAALAAALDASEAACAAVVQHYPRQLLLCNQPQTALAPQLRMLSEAAGVSIRELLEELEPEQSRGLAGLLLYEAGWIREQLRSLSARVEALRGPGTSLPGRQLVWLLLRLGSPNLTKPAQARAAVGVLQQIVAAFEPWAQEVQQASDRELAVLLTVGARELRRGLFLASTGKAGPCGVTLLEVVCWPEDEFEGQYGRDEFEAWDAQRHQ